MWIFTVAMYRTGMILTTHTHTPIIIPNQTQLPVFIDGE